MFLFNWVTNSIANQQPEDVSENVHIAPKTTINIKEHFKTDALVSDYTHENVRTTPLSGQYIKDHIHGNEVILADTIDDLQKRVKDLELTVATLIRKIQLQNSTSSTYCSDEHIVIDKNSPVIEQEKLPITPTATPNYAKSDEEQTHSPDEKIVPKTKKINGVMLDAFQAELTSKLEKIRCNMGASHGFDRDEIQAIMQLNKLYQNT